MFAFLVKFINLLIKALGVVLNLVFAILPDSPFQKYIVGNSTIKQYVGQINYFLPIAEILLILEAWCGAIAIFYVVQIILRWIKAIE